MKNRKFVAMALSAVLSVCLCGCGKADAPIEIGTWSATNAETVTKSVIESTQSETVTSAETAVIGADINVISKSYAEFLEFVSDETSLQLAETVINTEDTLLYNLMHGIAEKQAMYVDITDETDTIQCICAVDRSNMYINFNADGINTNEDTDGVVDAFNVLAEMTIVVKGNMLYFLDEETKTCYYTEADAEEIASLGYTDSIQGMFDISALQRVETMNICIVDIAGKLYQLEVYDAADTSRGDTEPMLYGYLFDETGRLCYYKAGDYGVKFNNITEEIPNGMFDIPVGMTKVSMDELYGN